MSENMPGQVTAAAKDLVPLARAIVSILGRTRGEGFVPLQPEQSAFFLYAAMAGASHFLTHVEGPLLPSHMRETAYELAPEIARLLAEDVTLPKRPLGRTMPKTPPTTTATMNRYGAIARDHDRLPEWDGPGLPRRATAELGAHDRRGARRCLAR